MNNALLPTVDVTVGDYVKTTGVGTGSKQQTASNDSREFADSMRDAEHEYTTQTKMQEEKSDSQVVEKPESQSQEIVAKPTETGGETAKNPDINEQTDTAAESDLSVENLVTTISEQLVAQFPELEPLADDIAEQLAAILAEEDPAGLEQMLDPAMLQQQLQQLLPDGTELPISSLVTISETLGKLKAIMTNDSLQTPKTINGTTAQALKELAAELAQQDGQAEVTLALKVRPGAPQDTGGLPKTTLVTALMEADLPPAKATGQAETLLANVKTTAESVAAQNATQPQAALSATKAQLTLATPMQQAQWGQAMAERVVWMTTQNIQQAEIHIDPPELGPIQVKVSVTNEQAHVSFVVQNSSVREALDQSAMRLREMFAEEALDLVDVDVSDQSQQQAGEQNPEQARGDLFADTSVDDAGIETPLTRSAESYSLINTYA